jgi:fumarate hydratase class II
VVWQTGSGTQTNMNVNEVLANRASELLGGVRGEARLVHPNDDVNKSQSSNDVFPTAMHVAAVQAITHRLLPAIAKLRTRWRPRRRTSPTSSRSAAPTCRTPRRSRWGRSFPAGPRNWRMARPMCAPPCPHLCELALGGTAVGTGLNAPKGYAEGRGGRAGAADGLPFVTAPNKFEVMASCDALVHAHGALKTLAAS